MRPRRQRRPCRSIPACAGEPSIYARTKTAARVYPRVCGGTFRMIQTGRMLTGLSPRVRGNRAAAPLRQPVRGSIPACAGEPRSPANLPSLARVYPRVCGGTSPTPPPTPMAKAACLSPRVRGNLPRISPQAASLGSIPACAGEPKRGHRSRQGSEVYPRVCGGTPTPTPAPTPVPGLSPRVRGNRV